MKKILILTSGEKKDKVCRSAIALGKELADKAEVINKKLCQVSVFLEGESATCLIDGLPFSDFNFVYFRSLGNYLRAASVVANILDYNLIPYADSFIKNTGSNKIVGITKLFLAGLPVLPTYYGADYENENLINEVEKWSAYPLIAKSLTVHRGDGVYLLHNSEELKNLAGKFKLNTFLFQKFVAVESEYRVLVLGKKIGCFEKKIKLESEEFRHNVALGAKEEFLPIRALPRRIKRDCLLAARNLRLEIAGVDIVVGKDGKHRILEVNRGPGFTYDDPRSPEIKNLAAFLRRGAG